MLEYAGQSKQSHTTDVLAGLYAFFGTRLCLAGQGSAPAERHCGTEAIVDPVARKRGFVSGNGFVASYNPPPEGVRPCSGHLPACSGCFEFVTQRYGDQDYLIVVREAGECYGWQATEPLLFKRIDNSATSQGHAS